MMEPKAKRTGRLAAHWGRFYGFCSHAMDRGMLAIGGKHNELDTDFDAKADWAIWRRCSFCCSGRILQFWMRLRGAKVRSSHLDKCKFCKAWTAESCLKSWLKKGKSSKLVT